MIETIQIRINDLNFGGHMGHVEFIHLLHEVRVRFLKAKGMDELNMEGFAIVMRHLAVDYLSQGFLHDELEVEITASREKARIVFHYQVYNRTQECVLGKAVAEMVLVDKATFRPVRASVLSEALFAD